MRTQANKRAKRNPKRNPKQLELKGTGGWGGKRKGAGRKNKSQTVNHMARPKITGKQPLHITMRLRDQLPFLRRPLLLKEFRQSSKLARRLGTNVVHFSLQGNHIHMIVEAPNNKVLAAGMQSLAGRFGKIIRAQADNAKTEGDQSKARQKMASKPQPTMRLGGHFNQDQRPSNQHAQIAAEAPFDQSRSPRSVFTGRYHLRVLKRPTDVRNVLEYVLLNHAKHRDFIEHLDPFSSGAHFAQWPELLGRRYRALIRREVEFNSPEESCGFGEPKSWLAKVGWTRAQTR